MKKIVALVLSLVMVLGLAVTAFGAVAPTLYYWNNNAEEWTAAGASFQPASGDLDDLKQDTDDGVMPCFKVGSAYFVEAVEAAATHKLVYGAKTVYLTEVADVAKISFEAKASVLKVVDEDDAVCGDYYVANLDDEDVYYASYNKDGSFKAAYVADKTSSKNVLVDGKLVAVADATVTQLDHSWVGYDVVNYAYTTVKCQNCGKVATLYANATAAGKGAEQIEIGGTVLGYITKADAGFAAAVVTPSTDKVESAETFDAGIAMYVGMSVMAAAGSAVVLKKKD